MQSCPRYKEKALPMKSAGFFLLDRLKLAKLRMYLSFNFIPV
jgi:hypothetical protein